MRRIWSVVVVMCAYIEENNRSAHSLFVVVFLPY
jgi:hypothetical protein